VIRHRKNRPFSILKISSKQISKDVCSLFHIEPGAKDRKICFPDLSSKKLQLAFVRGLFDGDGSVSNPYGRKEYKYPACSIASYSDDVKKAIRELFDSVNVTSSKIEWSGDEAMKVMSMIYDDALLYLPRKRERFEVWKCIRSFRKSSPF